jgi:hypothetical protein
VDAGENLFPLPKIQPVAWSLYQILYLSGERYVELEGMWTQRPEEVT